MEMGILNVNYECVCTVIMETSDYNDGMIDTLLSLDFQKMLSGEKIQVIIIWKGFEKFQESFLLKHFNNIIFNIVNYDNIKYLNKAILGEYFIFSQLGTIYTPEYFLKCLSYLRRKKEKRSLIGQYWTEKNCKMMQNVFYEKERTVNIMRNPEILVEYFDAVWFPSEEADQICYDGECEFIINCTRIMWFILLKEEKYYISGNMVQEYVYCKDNSLSKYIPSTQVMRDLYLRIINYSIVKNGKAVQFVQFILLNLFRKFIIKKYLLKNIIVNYGEKLEDYKNIVFYCLSYIDESVIFQDKFLSLEQKIFLLKKRYDSKLKGSVDINKNCLIYSNENVDFKIEYYPIIDFLFADIKENKLIIEGDIYLPQTGKKDFEIYFKVKEEKYAAKVRDNYMPETIFENEIISERIFFEIEIELTVEPMEISCWLVLSGQKGEVECRRYKYSRFFPVSAKNKDIVSYKKGYLFSANGARLYIESATEKKLEENQNSFYNKLSKEQRFLRELYFQRKCGKKIWLLWDRIDEAGDNAEALFLYLMNHPEQDEIYYFVIDEKSKDYLRLKKSYSNIVELGSMKHKRLFVLADVLIGTQTDMQMWILGDEVFRDIIASKPFVFLQHGITKNDMSYNYSKYFQNIRLFVTAGIPEYENIKLISNYGFSKDMVRLLGFPRFDLLENKQKKEIVVLPTWRKYCISQNTPGENSVEDGFEKSEYYKFYHDLLSDKELRNKCRKNGYRIILMQHKVMKASDKYFLDIEDIVIADERWSYKRVISEAAVLVTDYSSVSFDFAYLNKPMIYCQFDKEKFYETHTYKEGYFDYEKDGFGEVVYDCRNAVNAIIRLLDNNCIPLDKYRAREERFFGYKDHENCLRVANAIREVINDYER